MTHPLHPHSPLRIFAFSVFLTLAALVATAWYGNVAAVFTVAVLIVLELTFSFDNAVVNAKILHRMSPFWQKMFLTIGILIAVIGMRVVFPIAVVAVSAQMPIATVLQLAINDPHAYAHALEGAHTTIAAFGGAFLLMLSLSFMFDRQRKLEWIPIIERPLKQVGHPVLNTTIVAAVILGLVSVFMSGNESQAVAVSGALGMLTYLVIHGLATKFEQSQEKRLAAKKAVGMAGFYSFLYLEVIDASFSFDGVIGAFAITDQILLIAAGLGVGAIWVRSLTVYMVRRRTLDTYRYLDHGAHYAIGVLALILFFGITLEIPEWISGGAGMLFIGTSFVHSLIANKKQPTVIKLAE